MDIIWNEEELHLASTIQEMQEVLAECKRIFSTLEMKYRDEPRLLENMMSLYATRIRGIELSYAKPYFARIDFQREGDGSAQPYYIGKIGLSDRENNPLITDWRTPIASPSPLNHNLPLELQYAGDYSTRRGIGCRAEIFPIIRLKDV